MGPGIRLYELFVYRRYCQQHDPSYIDKNSFFDEKFCKLDNVQGELSMLQAWLLFWIYLVALPMTIPLGALADTVGRKAVIAMSLVAVTLMKVWVIIVGKIFRSPPCWSNLVLYYKKRLVLARFLHTFPPEAVYLCAAFRLPGGYQIRTMVTADVVSGEKRSATC